MRTRMMPQSSGFDEMPIPPALILPRKGEEISPFPLYGGRLGWACFCANQIPTPVKLPLAHVLDGFQGQVVSVNAEAVDRAFAHR